MAFPEGLASHQGGLSKGVSLYLNIKLTVHTCAACSAIEVKVVDFTHATVQHHDTRFTCALSTLSITHSPKLGSQRITSAH